MICRQRAAGIVRLEAAVWLPMIAQEMVEARRVRGHGDVGTLAGALLHVADHGRMWPATPDGWLGRRAGQAVLTTAVGLVHGNSSRLSGTNGVK